MLSDAPTKVSAFIGTLIEISRNYNVSVERFYHSALRTYQEMHDNYFEDIEHAAERFISEAGVADDYVADEHFLAFLLTEKYQYRIEPIDEVANPELKQVRSLAIPKTSGYRLLLKSGLSAAQRSFIFGRELGYHYLKLSNRLYSTTLLEDDSFEHLLNNFKASYFASAVIMRRTLLVPKLKTFFEQKTWQPERLLDMITFFETTPESFCYRVSNILPRHFGINQLFFLRFNNFGGQEQFDLTKEMHIARKHIPHTVKDEYYCRRWLAITVLQDLAERTKLDKGFHQTICQAQISRYVDTSEPYLMVSFAAPGGYAFNPNVSVTMGIYLDEDARKVIAFLYDPALRRREVNETCDRCGLFDCKERVAAPKVLQRKHKNDALKKTITAMLQENGVAVKS